MVVHRVALAPMVLVFLVDRCIPVVRTAYSLIFSFSFIDEAWALFVSCGPLSIRQYGGVE